jgi:hypothetical protein
MPRAKRAKVGEYPPLSLINLCGDGLKYFLGAVSLTKVDKKGKERKGNLISLVRIPTILLCGPKKKRRRKKKGKLIKERCDRSKNAWTSGTTSGSSTSATCGITI